ncbi:MAG: substrate-binding domain-containing protein [Sneathiella sp.]
MIASISPNNDRVADRIQGVKYAVQEHAGVARQMVILVPEDVSITGFDDLNIAAADSPALTTVRLPHLAMGKAAAEILLKLIRKDPNAESVELKTEIFQRQSLKRFS